MKLNPRGLVPDPRESPGHNRLRVPLLVVALLVSGLLSATASAEVRLSAGVEPSTVEVGEQAVLTIQVEGAASVDQPPSVSPVSGLDIRGGGQSTNISIVNGRMSRSVGFQYVVFGQRPGEFTLGPFEVRDGGKLYRSNAVTLTVTGGGSAAPPQQPGAAPPNARGGTGGFQQPEPEESGNLFVRAEVDRDHVVVGEQVTLRFQFYQRIDVPLLDSPQYTPPPTEGFWREDLPPQRTSSRTVRGVPYQVTELVYALFPTQSGRLEIGPGTLDCVVRDQRRDDPFSFFGNMFAQRQVRLASKPFSVRVDPLPEPRPADFTGGVGTYSLSTSLERSEVAQNDPVTLTVAVEGTGNVSTVGDPPMPELTGFRTYPSGSDVKADKRADIFGGKKSFQIVLVPESTGRKEIPPVRLSVYDPKQKRYVRLESQPLALSVLPASPESGGNEPGEVTRVGRDLRTIRTATSLRAAGSSEGWRHAGFWLLQALPLALLGLAFAWRLRGERREANWGLVLSRGAPARFRRELALLRRDPGLDPARGFDRLADALERYLTDRFHIPVRGLTREELQVRLREHSVAEESIQQVHLTLERCDFARFAPLAQSPDLLRRTVEEAARLPEILEKKAAPRAGVLPFLVSLLVLLVMGGGVAAGGGSAAGSMPGTSKIQPVPGMTREQAEEQFRRGNDAYAQGDFLAAARDYGRILASGYESTDLLLNLGNASYKLGRIGWAVYYYERGLRLDPKDPDLRANLDLASQETKDRAPEVDSSRFLRWLVSLQSSRSLASSVRWLALVWWIFLLWAALRVLAGGPSPGPAVRLRGGAGMVSGLVLGGLLLASAAWTGMKFVQASSGAGAVVVSDELAVRSNPDPEATVEFTLHAGTRVRLRRAATGYREVLFSDKLRGWGAAQDLVDLGASGTAAVAAADVETSLQPAAEGEGR